MIPSKNIVFEWKAKTIKSLLSGAKDVYEYTINKYKIISGLYKVNKKLLPDKWIKMYENIDNLDRGIILIVRKKVPGQSWIWKVWMYERRIYGWD